MDIDFERIKEGFNDIQGLVCRKIFEYNIDELSSFAPVYIKKGNGWYYNGL